MGSYTIPLIFIQIQFLVLSADIGYVETVPDLLQGEIGIHQGIRRVFVESGSVVFGQLKSYFWLRNLQTQPHINSVENCSEQS